MIPWDGVCLRVSRFFVPRYGKQTDVFIICMWDWYIKLIGEITAQNAAFLSHRQFILLKTHSDFMISLYLNSCKCGCFLLCEFIHEIVGFVCFQAGIINNDVAWFKEFILPAAQLTFSSYFWSYSPLTKQFQHDLSHKVRKRHFPSWLTRTIIKGNINKHYESSCELLRLTMTVAEL